MKVQRIERDIEGFGWVIFYLPKEKAVIGISASGGILFFQPIDFPLAWNLGKETEAPDSLFTDAKEAEKSYRDKKPISQDFLDIMQKLIDQTT